MFEDGILAFLYVVVISLIACLGLMIYVLIEEDKACQNAGGHWVGTGEYYTTTTTVMVGKVAVPQTNTYEETICVDDKGEVVYDEE